eukprot:3338224-Pyramimonas_sp.AAC.1
MISYVHDSGDTLHSVRAGKYLVVFLVRGSLYLVAAAATGEPVAVLAQQLHVRPPPDPPPSQGFLHTTEQYK